MTGATKSGALSARYGEAAGGLDPQWNAALDLLLSHRSVRAFAPDPVPPGTLDALIAAAQSAATSSNLQTWSVVVVEDRAVRARLAEIARGQKHVEDCPLFLVWLADLSRLEGLGKRVGRKTEALDYLEMFLMAAVDAALAAQNATVAAESLGLGGVYIGALRNRPQEVAELLGLPPNVFAVFGHCLGYPDPARPAHVKPRLPQSVVVHHGRYGEPAPVGAIAGYDETLKAFQRSEKMAEAGWTDVVMERVGTPASLTGRHILVDTLKKMGFGLK